MTFSLPRRAVAEAVGTAFLLATVVGSGIMAETLSDGNVALALLANAVATGAILIVLIQVFGPISGAHFNPAVTAVMLMRREMGARDGAVFIAAQIVGAVLGVVCAHAMFDAPLLEIGVKARTGGGQWISEAIATGGLILAILGARRASPASVPWAVGLYILAAYWFTASTSFANPAVTIARAFTTSFAGIAPVDAPAFIAAQIVGALAAAAGWAWLAEKDDAYSASSSLSSDSPPVKRAKTSSAS